jgi:hypothetical protein
MAAGRVLHAGLQLLDRQLVDRNDRLCGKVDDLELTKPDANGNLHIAAIVCGPGALLTRTGHRRLGRWLRHVTRVAFPSQGDDPARVPMARVADIGNHVTLSLESEELATFAVERWTRDHIVGHIPGSGHDAGE